MKCPNKSSKEWNVLVEQVGEKYAMEIYVKNDEEIPTQQELKNILHLESDRIKPASQDLITIRPNLNTNYTFESLKNSLESKLINSTESPFVLDKKEIKIDGEITDRGKQIVDEINKDLGFEGIRVIDNIVKFFDYRLEKNLRENQKSFNNKNSSYGIINEALASEDPELQNFIYEQFAELYPGVEIFTSEERFREYVANNGGPSNFDFESVGKAFGNAVYIDTNTAVQSTFFHEHAHLYWDALPEDNMIKKRLISFFEDKTNLDDDERIQEATEEAILEIGRIGTFLAETTLRGSNLDRFKVLLKGFWINVKSILGISNKKDLLFTMSNRIYKNKDKFTKFKSDQLWNMTVNDSFDIQEGNESTEFGFYDASGNKLFSPSYIIRTLKPDTFEEENIAARMVNKENRERIDNDENGLTHDQYLKRIDEIKAEWKDKATIGDEIHKMMEMIDINGNIDQSIKDRFESEKDFNKAFKTLNDLALELNPVNGDFKNELRVGNIEDGLAGIIDKVVEKSEGKAIVYDFKTGSESFYQEDGVTLAERITNPYLGKKLNTPLNGTDASKIKEFAIQTNLYSHLLEKQSDVKVVEQKIIPIIFDYNKENGKISNLRYEKAIDMPKIPGTVEALIEYSKRRKEEEQKAIENIEESDTYGMSPIAKKEMIEAISELTTVFGDLSMINKDADGNKNYSKGEEMLKNKFDHFRKDLIDKGIPESEINGIPLQALMVYYSSPYDGEIEEVNTNLELPDTITFIKTNKLNPNDSADMYKIQQYEMHKKIVQGIYEKLKTIEDLEKLSIEQLRHYENTLLSLDPTATSGLLQYIQNKLAMIHIIDKVAEENKVGSHGYRVATVAAYQIFTGKLTTVELSKNFSMKTWLINDRRITSDNSIQSFFVNEIREQTNKVEDDENNIAEEIKRFRISSYKAFSYKKLFSLPGIKSIGTRKSIDMSKITATGKYGKKMFKFSYTEEEEKLLTQDEQDFLKFIKKWYIKLDPYHKFKYDQASERGFTYNPVIFVPRDYATTWQLNKKFTPLMGWYMNRLLNNSKYDSTYVYSDNGTKITYGMMKEHFSFNNPIEFFRKLIMLAQAKKRAKAQFQDDMNRRNTVKAMNLQSKISGNANKIIRYENNQVFDIIQGQLNSMSAKFNMEKVIPLAQFTISQYENSKGEVLKNFKNIHQWTRIYAQRRISGKLDSKSELGNILGPIFNWSMKNMALVRLAFNPIAQAVNLGVGTLSNIVHARQKYIIGINRILLGDLLSLRKFLDNPLTHIPESTLRIAGNFYKITVLLKKFRIVDITSEHNFDSFSQAKTLFEKISFVLTTVVENMNQGTLLASFLTSKQWDAYDWKGNVIDQENALQESERRVIENKVREAHGDYGIKNAWIGSYFMIGQGLSQFRRWLPAYVWARFGKSIIDSNGVHQRGYYWSGFVYINTLLYNLKGKESRKELYEVYKQKTDRELLTGIQQYIKDAESGKIDISKMSQTDKEAIAKFTIELIMILSSFALWGAASDDEKKERAKWIYGVIGDRIYTDVTMFQSPDMWKSLAESPMPALKFLVDFGNFLYYLKEGVISGEFEKYDKDYPMYGIKAGDTKLYYRFKKVVPFGSFIRDFDIFNKNFK